MPTLDELKFLQNLPLEIKIAKTKQRFREWHNFFGGEVYISFSGGKHSTVLLDIARQSYPNIQAVFVDTGLEYPEIRSFVKTFDNVQTLRPKMRFDEVIKQYGFPVISKDIARKIYDYKKNPNSYAKEYVNGTALTRNGKASQYCCNKYKYLLDAPFNVSHLCCDITKKAPLKSIKNMNAITGQTAEESKQRKNIWLQYGCNMFNGTKPISNPMSFWTDQDVLTYIKQNNLKIASVYGDICEVDSDGNLFYGLGEAKLKCSGCQRTGCMFCAFGAHLEKGNDRRFIRLKHTHPKQYDYCINGGEYDISDGMWKPNHKGLGMGKVLEFINVDF